MRAYDTCVIGGGAAGMVAAISAKRAGRSVVICEKMPVPGKKVLISGNGRCNLSNEHITCDDYNEAARPLAASVFKKFSPEDILRFFGGLGLKVYSDGPRIFPTTNQASSVVKVLLLELKRLSVGIELECEAVSVSGGKGKFTVKTKPSPGIECRNVIIACGGKAYPALGSDGSGYKLAASLGHSVIEPVPSAVPLTVKDHLCHLLQGQKITAKTKSIIDGKAAQEASGDLLFTKYGLSGTAVIDVSGSVSIALNRQHKKNVIVEIDMVPFMDEAELSETIAARIKAGWAAEDLLAGVLPNKFGNALLPALTAGNIAGIKQTLKHRQFRIEGTRGWNECEFSSGGVASSEVQPTLESRKCGGVYLAGEVLDVSGPRGGYNLAWAWASGYVAGLGE